MSSLTTAWLAARRRWRWPSPSSLLPGVRAYTPSPWTQPTKTLSSHSPRRLHRDDAGSVGVAVCVGYDGVTWGHSLARRHAVASGVGYRWGDAKKGCRGICVSLSITLCNIASYISRGERI